MYNISIYISFTNKWTTGLWVMIKLILQTPLTVGRYWDLHWHPSVFRRKHGTSVRSHVTAKQHQSIACPTRFLSWKQVSACGSPSMSTCKKSNGQTFSSNEIVYFLPAPSFKDTCLKCFLQPLKPAHWPCGPQLPHVPHVFQCIELVKHLWPEHCHSRKVAKKAPEPSSRTKVIKDFRPIYTYSAHTLAKT